MNNDNYKNNDYIKQHARNVQLISKVGSSVECKAKSKILYDSVERDQFNVRFLACGKKPCDTFLKLQR